MNIISLAKRNEELLISIRRHLHQYPEVSGKEYKTLEFIQKKLNEFGITYVEVEEGGILGFIGKKQAKKTVLLRADIDALPMQEAPNNMKQPKECPVSNNPGVAHTCGHDAHAAMLLVAGKILQEHCDQLNGQVILCFERGEEGGNNIEYILRYLEQEKIRIDGCHALHVVPNIPAGKISARYGEVLAGSFGFEVEIKGKGGHGSRPDLSNNPLDCFHAIYSDMNMIRMRDVSPFHQMTFSIGKVQCGTSWNIIDSKLTFAGNGRFFHRDEAGMVLRNKLQSIVSSNAELYGCTCSFTSMRGPSFGVINNKECVDVARAGIDKYLGSDIQYEQAPDFASESMSLMMKLYPGAYCLLGTGNAQKGISANPHNPMYDIDESALYIGVAANIAYAVEFMESDCQPKFEPFNGTVDELISMSTGQCFN